MIPSDVDISVSGLAREYPHSETAIWALLFSTLSRRGNCGSQRVQLIKEQVIKD